jgi:hypothetical protein
MITETYLTLAVQSTIVLGSAAAASIALGKASAALRHAIWAASFCLLLYLPVTPRIGWFSFTQAVAIPQELQPAAGRERVVVKGESNPGMNWPAILLAVHLTGAALLMGRAIWAKARLEEAVNDGTLEVPVALGLWEPRVHLPKEAESWSPERREAVLAHESEHVRRLDLWWQLLATVGTALYWPNPLVWWARKKLLEECEQACDDGVLARGVAPSRYAEHLVEIARGLGAAKNRIEWEGGLAMSRPNSLQQRITMILDPMRSHEGVTKGTLALVAMCAMALLGPVAGYRVMAQGPVGLSGVVKDASGAAVPSARVSLALGERQEVTRTNDAGEFRFPGLPAGNWKVQVQKEGFALMELTGLEVKPNEGTRFDPVLYVGSIKETMSVVGRDSSLPPPPPPPPPPAGFTPSPLRVGGNVQAAKIITRVPPVYPPDCKAERVQGTVLLMAVIGKDGSILSLRPLNQLVDARLVRAATEAVQQWRYQTTLLNGNPVEILTQIEVNFTLAP